MANAQEILNRKGGGAGSADRVGETLSIVEAEFEAGQYKDEDGNVKDFVRITAFDAEGNDRSFSAGSPAIVSKLKELKDGGFLPFDVKVTSYPGSYGNPGYDISPVDR